MFTRHYGCSLSNFQFFLNVVYNGLKFLTLLINQYLCNGSNVYSCLLDPSKTIDRVHYGTMFSI